MKVAIASDSHYDLIDGELKRNDDIHRVFGDIISEVIEQKIPMFVHCGDLYTTNNPTTQAIGYSINNFKRLQDAEVMSYVLVGNHDVISQFGKVSALEPLRACGYEFVKVIDLPKIEKINKKVYFMFMPHVSKSRVVANGYSNLEDFWERSVQDMFSQVPDGCFIYVFAHHNISGAVSGSESWMIRGDEQSIPNSIFENDKVRAVFNGHIHKPQAFRKGKTTVVIVGSIECMNMGERNERKGYVTVEVEE
jgi:DNA repair exonuclease SbcCD nuclease subunit